MKYTNKDKKVKIKCYTKEYRSKVIEFLIGIAIKEFGFKEWKPYFEEAKFLEVSDKEEFWIAVDVDDNILGTIGIMNDIQTDTAKLHSLYVRKDGRRNGVATELYKTSFKFAKECNYKKIILHTYREFETAIKFYEKKGFCLDEDIKSKDGIWYSKNINSNKDFRWNDYFSSMRNKYSMRISLNKPLIINLDGKEITNNPSFSLIDNKSIGGFLDIMEKSVMYFTRRYNCISISGTDEVSFIFEEPKRLVNELNTDLNTKSDEIISMFSQLFFDYFNSINTKEKVFWHGECFSIPYGKINSYIKYKSGSIKNTLTTYFLKKNNVKNAGKIKLLKKIEECKKYDFYENELKEIESGILYCNGDKIDIEQFLKGNIKKIDSQPKQRANFYLDITEW